MQVLRKHIVALPAGVDPEIPGECVACGAPDPEGVIRVSDRAMTWSALFFFWMHWAGRKDQRSFRACGSCALRDRFVWLGRLVSAVVLIGVTIAYAAPYYRGLGWPRGLVRLATLGTVLVALLPAILWTLWFPRPVTLDVKKDVTEFEFARADYAARFAEANRGRRSLS